MALRKTTFLNWRGALTVLGLGGGLTLFGYVSAQQVVRGTANIAPALAASAAAEHLSNKQPKDVVGPLVTQPGGAVLPDIYVFDENRQPVATNIYSEGTDLGGAVQPPPKGSFAVAKAGGENRFTWKPDNGPRQAAVLVHNRDGKGYVLAASSLVEPERIVDQVGVLAGATMLGVFLLAVIIAFV